MSTYQKLADRWEKLRSRARPCEDDAALIDDLLAEVSYLECRLCELDGGYRWEDREQNEFMNVEPWRECTRCGSARVDGPAIWRARLRLVEEEVTP
jgi:hypothetical protein